MLRSLERVVLGALLTGLGGCSDGIRAPKPLQGDAALQDASALDADPLAALGLLEAGIVYQNVPAACPERLTGYASESYSFDTSDCERRPAATCRTGDARENPGYASLHAPSDYIAYDLFEECGGGFYPVGIAFTEQGCAETFYAPLYPEDEALSCFLRALKERRYPCGIRCSQDFNF